MDHAQLGGARGEHFCSDVFPLGPSTSTATATATAEAIASASAASGGAV
jgi:hypothetical protein